MSKKKKCQIKNTYLAITACVHESAHPVKTRGGIGGGRRAQPEALARQRSDVLAVNLGGVARIHPGLALVVRSTIGLVKPVQK